MKKGEKQQKQNNSSGLQVSARERGTGHRQTGAPRCVMASCRKGQGCLQVLDTGTVLTLEPSPCPGCKVPPVTGSEL